MKYGKWHVLHPVGMNYSKGHVSKLAEPEAELIFEIMDRQIREGSGSAYSDVWMKKAA